MCSRLHINRQKNIFFGIGGLLFWCLSQGSYGGYDLFVYYKTGQDQGHIRNKWVVQTQLCPLLVDIEMNRSSSNPGVLLAHQNVETGVSTWSAREVLPEQVSRHWDCSLWTDPAATQVPHWLTRKSKQVYPTVQDHVCRYSSDIWWASRLTPPSKPTHHGVHNNYCTPWHHHNEHSLSN